MDEVGQPGDDRRGDALSGRAASSSAGVDPAREPLPEALRQRLDRCAADWLVECAARRDASLTTPGTRRTLAWTAVAVAMLLALAGGWQRLDRFAPGVTATELNQRTVERERQQLLATAGVEHLSWGGASAAGAGDVVWDPRTQRGFLRLRGCAANDPLRTQYRVWVFDAARDDRDPVDGGVFDVPVGRDAVVIPVRPARPVSRAVAFAVTVEQPGGTVVSDRTELVAFARVGR